MREILLEKCLNGKISPRNRLLDIVFDMKLKTDEKQFPDSILFFKDGEVLMEQNLKSQYLRVDYFRIWSIFEKEFGFNNQEISLLIKGIMEKHFKMRVLASRFTRRVLPIQWKSVSR